MLLPDRPNVLVTGGAGFIGSHLCDELVKDHHVICVDNFITGQEENIDHLLEYPNFEFVNHDLTTPFDPVKLPELKKFRIESLGIQEMYNLACPTSPKQYNHLPIETLRANADGTKHILELAIRWKSKIVHVSSDAVYGEPLVYEPFKEEYYGMVDPLGQRSAYNEGKRFAETMVTNYARQYGLQVKIARVFSTYGPRMKVDDGRMIPDFIMSVLRSTPIVIYGSPDDATTLCYVTDLVEALLAFMRSELTGPLNVGSDVSVKVVDVAKQVMALVGGSVAVEFKFHLPYIHRQGMPDLSKAREQLSWFPMVPPEIGLTKTIDYLRARMKTKGIK